MDTFEPRRITDKPKNADGDRLKHIAGLIQKLTFREMNELSGLLQNHEKHMEDEGYPESLLRVADEILNR